MTVQIVPDAETAEARQTRLARRTASGRQIFAMQAAAIQALCHEHDIGLADAVELILSVRGRLVVSGMGKSGHIGGKLAATFASTGTPSFFVHPGEAYHGDLGMFAAGDAALLISYSGETDEVVRLIPTLKELGVPIIALVGNPESTLARGSTVVLNGSVEREACPNNLAPTNSTLAALAIGDALAVLLIEERDFQPKDFAQFHPGGSLGRRLLSKVRDHMETSPLPQVPEGTTVGESLFVMTRGRRGLCMVMRSQKLLGVITDGDLRRAMQRHADIMPLRVEEIMTTSPLTVRETAPLHEAEDLMRERKIKAVVVLNDDDYVTGILDIFDH